LLAFVRLLRPPIGVLSRQQSRCCTRAREPHGKRVGKGFSLVREGQAQMPHLFSPSRFKSQGIRQRLGRCLPRRISTRLRSINDPVGTMEYQADRSSKSVPASREMAENSAVAVSGQEVATQAATETSLQRVGRLRSDKRLRARFPRGVCERCAGAILGAGLREGSRRILPIRAAMKPHQGDLHSPSSPTLAGRFTRSLACRSLCAPFCLRRP
jgi:hypothetical protein